MEPVGTIYLGYYLKCHKSSDIVQVFDCGICNSCKLKFNNENAIYCQMCGNKLDIYYDDDVRFRSIYDTPLFNVVTAPWATAVTFDQHDIDWVRNNFDPISNRRIGNDDANIEYLLTFNMIDINVMSSNVVDFEPTTLLPPSEIDIQRIKKLVTYKDVQLLYGAVCDKLYTSDEYDNFGM